jgi:phosphatidylglycerol:prolipoprotein diacylglycerol transferase
MIPVFHIGPFTFYTFGLVFGAAICLAWPIFERYFQLHGLAPRLNQSALALIVISSGFVGAKTDYALINRHANVTFMHALTDLTSGYTYLGCILAGCLSAAIYARFRGIPILELYDSLFCLAPSYAFGRIGCFLAGDGDYGISTTLP